MICRDEERTLVFGYKGAINQVASYTRIYWVKAVF